MLSNLILTFPAKNIKKYFYRGNFLRILYKRKDDYDEKSREHGSIIELSQSLNMMGAFIQKVFSNSKSRFSKK